MNASLYTLLLVGSVALLSLSLTIISLVVYLHKQMSRPAGQVFSTACYTNRTHGE